MNLILLNNNQINNGYTEIKGKKLEHILSFIKPAVGDTVKVGILNGLIGKGYITYIDDKKLALTLTLQDNPPSPLPLKLILAMPRPKVLKRIIQHATTMGVKEIYIIKTWRVEKSYWLSPVLSENNLKKQMISGLEQGKDTVLPTINIRKRFKPFVEDELPLISNGTICLTAHPEAKDKCPRNVNGPVTLVIGPEGGLIQYEIDALSSIGFKATSLGKRIFKVETVLPLIIGRLF